MQQKSAKTLVDLDAGLRFAKCPRWLHQRLLFLDVHDRCIKSTDMTGTVRTEKALSYLPAGLAILATDGLLVGDAWRRKLYALEQDCHEQVADLSSAARFCLSDAIVARRAGYMSVMWDSIS